MVIVRVFIEDLNVTDIRQKIISNTMSKITEAENNLVLDALLIHTGEVFCKDTVYKIKDRLSLQIRGKVKYILLDGKEILEIHPLEFDNEDDERLIIKTNFKYRVYPK